MAYRLNEGNRIVGTKQVKRALINEKAKMVYIADDADNRIRNEIITICNEKHVPIVHIETMEKLGKACRLEVSAATAALLK